MVAGIERDAVGVAADGTRIDAIAGTGYTVVAGRAEAAQVGEAIWATTAARNDVVDMAARAGAAGGDATPAIPLQGPAAQLPPEAGLVEAITNHGCLQQEPETQNTRREGRVQITLDAMGHADVNIFGSRRQALCATFLMPPRK